MSTPADMLNRWYDRWYGSSDESAEEAGIEALGWVDERCDGLLEINELLRTADVLRLPTPVLLDLLASTQPIAPVLPDRESFVAGCRRTLTGRLGAERAEKLLRHRA